MKLLGLKIPALERVVVECLFAGPLSVWERGNEGEGRGLGGTEKEDYVLLCEAGTCIAAG